MAREYLDFDSPEDAVINAEKAKARTLRKSRWWQQKTASGRCYYCRQKVAFQELTMDHLVPLARGGRSTKENLVPACKSCNNKKKTMLPIEWQEFMETMQTQTED